MQQLNVINETGFLFQLKILCQLKKVLDIYDGI